MEIDGLIFSWKADQKELTEMAFSNGKKQKDSYFFRFSFFQQLGLNIGMLRVQINTASCIERYWREEGLPLHEC